MKSIVITLEGERYRLIAEIEPEGTRRASFTVRAIHKDTGRTSVVNQVNAILAVFFAEKFPLDWPWVADWGTVLAWTQTFVSIAKTSTVSTWDQLAYLEAQLDEDRAEGEWVNVVSSITPSLAFAEPAEPDFPFCSECAQNRDGEPCHDCQAWVCMKCAHINEGVVRCDNCYRRWCDAERERHTHALDQALLKRETPLGEKLDENLAEGIDF